MGAGATKTILLVMLLAVLGGCAANRTAWGVAVIKDVYCTIDDNGDGVISDEEKGLYVPVEQSSRDTLVTQQQNLVNNTVHDDTCGVQP